MASRGCSPAGALDPTFSPGSSANDVVYSVFLSPDESQDLRRRHVHLVQWHPPRRAGPAVPRRHGGHRLSGHGLQPVRRPDQPAVQPRPLSAQCRLRHRPGESFNWSMAQRHPGGGCPHRRQLQPWSAAAAGTRRSYDYRENLALLRGGSTIGPGNLTLTYPNGSGYNNANKNGQSLQVTLTRTNGTLGSVGARFSPDPQPVGPGAAIYGQDYTYDPVTSGEAVFGSTWGPRIGCTRMLSDGIWGTTTTPIPCRCFLPMCWRHPSTSPRWTSSTTSTVFGNRSYNLNLSHPLPGRHLLPRRGQHPAGHRPGTGDQPPRP